MIAMGLASLTLDTILRPGFLRGSGQRRDLEATARASVRLAMRPLKSIRRLRGDSRGRDLRCRSPDPPGRTRAQTPGRGVGLLPLSTADTLILLRDVGHGLVRPWPPTSRVSR
jgi:hypothetical protein